MAAFLFLLLHIMKKHTAIFIVLVFTIVKTSFTQDITGLWKGYVYNDTTQKTLNYEIAISEEDGKYFGYSYTLFDLDGKEVMGLKKIIIKRKDGQVHIEDDRLIANNYGQDPPKGVKQISDLTLIIKDSVLILEGKWRTNRTKMFRPVTGMLSVTRKREFKDLGLFNKLKELSLDHTLSFYQPEKKQEQVTVVVKESKPVVKDTSKLVAINKPVVAIAKEPKPPVVKREKVMRPKTDSTLKAVIVPAAEVKKRSSPKSRYIDFVSDSLTLTLYDNGEIDGDTVSILLNGVVIIPRQGLTAKPFTKTIYPPQEAGDSLVLEMYAENLGSIPPNSGLLIINDGNNRNEIFFSADLKTNAAIVLRRKKK